MCCGCTAPVLCDYSYCSVLYCGIAVVWGAQLGGAQLGLGLGTGTGQRGPSSVESRRVAAIAAYSHSHTL
eukprot:scaffold354_cov116-Isochrysis_galbana.AAC.4